MESDTDDSRYIFQDGSSMDSSSFFGGKMRDNFEYNGEDEESISNDIPGVKMQSVYGRKVMGNEGGDTLQRHRIVDLVSTIPARSSSASSSSDSSSSSLSVSAHALDNEDEVFSRSEKEDGSTTSAAKSTSESSNRVEDIHQETSELQPGKKEPNEEHLRAVTPVEERTRLSVEAAKQTPFDDRSRGSVSSVSNDSTNRILTPHSLLGPAHDDDDDGQDEENRNMQDAEKTDASYRSPMHQQQQRQQEHQEDGTHASSTRPNQDASTLQSAGTSVHPGDAPAAAAKATSAVLHGTGDGALYKNSQPIVDMDNSHHIYDEELGGNRPPLVIGKWDTAKPDSPHDPNDGRFLYYHINTGKRDRSDSIDSRSLSSVGTYSVVSDFRRATLAAAANNRGHDPQHQQHQDDDDHHQDIGNNGSSLKNTSYDTKNTTHDSHNSDDNDSAEIAKRDEYEGHDHMTHYGCSLFARVIIAVALLLFGVVFILVGIYMTTGAFDSDKNSEDGADNSGDVPDDDLWKEWIQNHG